jgi:hypothetical protein
MLYTELNYCRITAATQAERRVFLAIFLEQTVGRDPGPWRILGSVGAGEFAKPSLSYLQNGVEWIRLERPSSHQCTMQ